MNGSDRTMNGDLFDSAQDEELPEVDIDSAQQELQLCIPEVEEQLEQLRETKKVRKETMDETVSI
jgi:hypothetical protein